MQQWIQSREVTDAATAASGLTAAPLSRRLLLRALPGVAVGVVALVGLTSCGGEEDEDEGDD